MQSFFDWIIFGIIFVNSIFALITVFSQERQVAAIWAWILVLVLLPGFGFILYYFLGRRISNEEIFKLSEQEALGMTSLADKYVSKNGKHKDLAAYDRRTQRTINMLYHSNMSILTRQNELDIFTYGPDKMHSLIEDIKKAKHHIHIQYYIFTPDHVGQAIIDALCQRARAGVKVRFLYDPYGSRKMRKRHVNALKDAGIEVNSFFGRKYFFINLRLNFRNHRKIAIIDGKTAYVGGFNIAKEYVDEGPLGHWRDTHLRIQGEAVQALQTRFVQDWCATQNMDYQDFIDLENGEEAKFFPDISVTSVHPVQIVSSGPEDDSDQIKMGYIRLINLAEESIYIQTPYFIPDESVLDALRIAILSGVKVHLMVPCKPDHPFVYRATEYYCRVLVEMGAMVHRYDNGFLHAKVVIVDGKVASVGTANWDIRSFSLNFEVNAFIFDSATVERLKVSYLKDIEVSTLMTKEYFAKQPAYRRFKQNFSRLLSPIL